MTREPQNAGEFASSGFLWGVATSGYQVEGGYNREGEPQTNWGVAERHNSVAPAGDASGFWKLYPEDFQRCHDLGLKAFRLGIEWSRVQPSFDMHPGKGENPPPFDEEALRHYGEILVECRKASLEPVVTLHHFVHPLWLGMDPWLYPSMVEYFTAFVEKTVEFLNDYLTQRRHDPIRYFITINEPNMLVLNTYFGTQFPGRSVIKLNAIHLAYNHLLAAHVVAYNKIHDIHEGRGWETPKVSLNTYCADLYWSEKVLLDLLMLRERGVEREDVTFHLLQKAEQFDEALRSARIPLKRDLPYYVGAFSKRLVNWIGYRTFDSEAFRYFLDVLWTAKRRTTLDFVGLDYYDPFTAHSLRLPVLWDHEFKNKSFHSWIMNAVTSKWWDWRVLPRGLHFFCRYYSEDMNGKPVLIAENGMAHRRRRDNKTSGRRDKMTRSQFLRLHVHEVTKIVNEGIPLIGYLHWSLVDNYEWGTFTPRFGIFSLDYEKGMDRNVTDHLDDRPSETYAALIAEARAKMGTIKTG